MAKCSWSARTGGLLLCGMLLWAAAFHANAQILRIGGTGSALGTMRLLTTALSKVDPKQSAVGIVPNLGSSGALRALAAGAIDMAVIGRSLRTEDVAAGLIGIEYGHSPVVFVSSKPGVKSITAAAVADALSGRMMAWPDGEPLRFVMRPETDGDNIFLIKSPQGGAILEAHGHLVAH